MSALVDTRLVLDELVGALHDAQRRHAAGDTRALDSQMLAATLRQAEGALEATSDPRFGEPVTGNEVAGLAVAFKALVKRAGGRVEFTNPELEEARDLLARVDADEELMVVEIVEGEPPDVPRFACDVDESAGLRESG